MASSDPSPAGGDTPPKKRRNPLWGRALIFLILVAATVAVALFAPISSLRKAGAIREWIAPLGVWAYVGYVGALMLGEALWMPRMVLITAGGLVFGPLWGGLLSIIADLTAGSIFYVMASSLARPAVESMLAKHKRAQEMVETVAKTHGVAAVALLRVCPLAHYTVFSYACGFTGVPFRSYLLGTLLGIVPGACIYPFFGSAILNPGSATFWFAAGSLVVFLVGTLWLGRRLMDSGSSKKTDNGLRLLEK